MARKSHNRRTGGRRPDRKRNIKKTLHILCEGENTEPDYFSAFPVTNIAVKCIGFGQQHTKLVETAIAYRKREGIKKSKTQVPFLNLVLAYLSRLEEVGELKLTAKGNLPKKWVLELYGLGLIKESHVESGIIKLTKEIDSLTVQHTKMLCELTGLTKKRNNKLSLTAKGKKLFNNTSKAELLEKLFISNLKDFNLAYHDGYIENAGIQQTFGYTLYLLLRYGKEEKPLTFYVDKNTQAFPMILSKFEGEWRSPEEMYASCYGVRIFERFLSLYGFVDYPNNSLVSNPNKSLKATDIFYQIFEIRKEHFSFKKSDFES